MTDQVCFVDVETTGLHPDKHSIWEVALITPNGDEHVWQFPIVEIDADPFALDIGRYWDRKWHIDAWGVKPEDAIYQAHTPKARRQNFPSQGRAIRPSPDWCAHFRDLTAGYHLAGAVVSFDEERLRRLLAHHGVLHRWHYHLIDIEALAVGYLTGRRYLAEFPAASLPWDSQALASALGVKVDETDRHTALGDARWARDMYFAVMGR